MTRVVKEWAILHIILWMIFLSISQSKHMKIDSLSWKNIGLKVPISTRKIFKCNNTSPYRRRLIDQYLLSPSSFPSLSASASFDKNTLNTDDYTYAEAIVEDGDSPIPPLHLSNYYNNEYVGTLGVGTPAQYLTVIFDTGSSDIWFPSKKCSTCGKHTLYDSSKSLTYNLKSDGTKSTHTDKTFSINYGSGKVSGIIALETIQISTLRIPAVLIGEVTLEDALIASFDMDGLVGLAFDGLSIVSRPGLIDSLQHSYPNLSHSFSFYLNTDPTDISSPSMIIFGGYDLNLVSSSAKFYYTPLVRDTPGLTYWTVSLSAFEISLETTFSSLNDLTIQYSVCAYGSKCLAIIDTGTSGIGIPDIYYGGIIKILTNGMDCRDLTCINVDESHFPILTISLAPDNVFPLLPSDYLTCSAHKVCVLRFQTSTDIWIFGDVFVEAYYTHFDAKNMRVGFACDGQCDGGSWHGTGGDFYYSNDIPMWKRAAFIYSIFVLLLGIFITIVNASRKCIEDVDGNHENEDDFNPFEKPLPRKLQRKTYTAIDDNRNDSNTTEHNLIDLDQPISKNRNKDYRSIIDNNVNNTPIFVTEATTYRNISIYGQDQGYGYDHGYDGDRDSNNNRRKNMESRELDHLRYDKQANSETDESAALLASSSRLSPSNYDMI